MQDTIQALRALKAFADRDPNRGLYSLKIDIESTGTDGWHREIHLYKGSYNNYTTYSVSLCMYV